MKRLNLVSPVIIDGIETNLNTYTSMIGEEQSGAYHYFTQENFHWNVPSSLINKVYANGNLKPYFGNTVVFTLDTIEIKKVKEIQSFLRKRLNFLAFPLESSSFHITLHDLFHAGDQVSIRDRINSSLPIINNIFDEISRAIDLNLSERFINLKVSKVIPSVNTSMVMGYVPVSEADYKKLFNIYKLFDSITKLNYFFRPHITLDYFIPTDLTFDQKRSFAQMLIDINTLELPNIKLDLRNLVYQLFYSMNEYQIAVSLGPSV